MTTTTEPAPTGLWRVSPGFQEVHDLHVWTIRSGFPALSALQVDHALAPQLIHLERRGSISEGS
jgi:Co/Zn/Cd efflux system component